MQGSSERQVSGMTKPLMTFSSLPVAAHVGISPALLCCPTTLLVLSIDKDIQELIHNNVHNVAKQNPSILLTLTGTSLL